MPTIRMMDFLSKLGDAFFVVYNTLSIIKRPDVQKVIVNTMTQGTNQLLQELENAGVFRPDTPRKIAGIKSFVARKLEDANLQKVQKYVPVLLNQNLVMLCTIMEIFFAHILETIMLTEPNVLVGLAQEKNLDLRRILSLKTYESILEEFRCKILDRFSRQGLTEKFGIYEKIGLDIDKVFDYSAYGDGVRKRLAGHNLAKLCEVFDKRHGIVHKNELPLKELRELLEIKDLFEKTVLNLSTLVMDKFAILLDVQESLVRSGVPRDTIPVRERKREPDD